MENPLLELGAEGPLVNQPGEKSQRYLLLNFEEDMHVVPAEDSFEHDAHVNCPCHPFVNNRQDVMRGLAHCYVWEHRLVSDKEEAH